MEPKTAGRWPTLGELFEYYRRDDICAAIYHQTRHGQILVQSKGRHLLTPSSEKETGPLLADHLRRFAKGIGENQRLAHGMPMHLLRDRGPKAGNRFDFTIEGDFRSWSQAFANMPKAMDFLAEEGIYHRVKFSGSRSLHLIIPAEVFPKTWNGKPLNEQYAAIERRLKAFLPVTGNVTNGLRAVYSVHPKGGLVSMPLYRRELPNFHPWMANIYTVAVDLDWFSLPPEAVGQGGRLLELAFAPQRQSPKVHAPRFAPQPVRS